MGFFDFLFGSTPEADPNSGQFLYPQNQAPKIGEGGIAQLQSGRTMSAAPWMTSPWRTMDMFFNDWNPATMQMHMPQYTGQQYQPPPGPAFPIMPNFQHQPAAATQAYQPPAQTSPQGQYMGGYQPQLGFGSFLQMLAQGMANSQGPPQQQQQGSQQNQQNSSSNNKQGAG